MEEVLFPTETTATLSHLERCHRRDPYAFSELVILNEASIKNILASTGKSADEIEEILQEAYCVAWNKIDQLQETNKFTSWVVQIAVNIHFRMYRKEKSRKTLLQKIFPLNLFHSGLETSRNYDAPEYRATMEDDLRFARQRLSELPLDCRMAYSLFIETGNSIPEIAEILDVNQKEVVKLIKKAEKILAQKLQTYSMAVLAVGTSITSPLPKVMDMILAGKLTPPAPEFLMAASSATGSAAKSVVGSVLSLVSVPFVWCLTFLVSCQVFALTVIHNAPTQYARLWLVNRLFWGYCLVFLAPLFFLLSGEIIESHVLPQQAQWYVAILGIPLLISYPVVLLSFVYSYNKASRVENISSLHSSIASVKKRIDYGFGLSAVILAILYVVFTMDNFKVYPYIRTIISLVLFGIFVFGFHLSSFILFRKFIHAVKEDQKAGNSFVSPSIRFQTSLRNEICFILPAFVVTTGGSIIHLLLVRTHSIYMFFETILLCGVWTIISLSNMYSPQKRMIRILMTLFTILVFIWVFRSFLIVST